VEEITMDNGVRMALDAIHADRLALICGAGLSMASPSNLPSASALAALAQTRYAALYGLDRPPLPAAIEDQAQFFFEHGELSTVYLRQLIDFDSFAAPPNDGHLALADMLLVRGIQTAVTTNVDWLIEAAGLSLFGQIGAGIDVASLAVLLPDRAPLLKLHGCWQIDPFNTLWAAGQLSVEPFKARVTASQQWLAVNLSDRDLIIVGYWTDWDYLNAVLDSTLGILQPARVIVVDPSERSSFSTKAPALYALGGRATASFCHVHESGATFLDRLGHEFSRSFVRQALHAGICAYEDALGTPPHQAWTEPPELTAREFRLLRRDLEGSMPNKPAKLRRPVADSQLGLTLLQLQARGAIPDGTYWELAGRRIRVIRCAGQMLHHAESTYSREVAPAIAPDLIIAVGAENQTLPADIVRSGTPATITRGSAGAWRTRGEAIVELHL
jgi:hypothetical protein